MTEFREDQWYTDAEGNRLQYKGTDVFHGELTLRFYGAWSGRTCHLRPEEAEVRFGRTTGHQMSIGVFFPTDPLADRRTMRVLVCGRERTDYEIYRREPDGRPMVYFPDMLSDDEVRSVQIVRRPEKRLF